MILAPALDGDDDKAEADVTTWRWCDVEFDLPHGVAALTVSDDRGVFPPGSFELRPEKGNEHSILVSGEDGRVLMQPEIAGQSTDLLLDAADSFRKVSGTPDVWPYTDDRRGSELGPNYRSPSPAAGIQVSSVSGDSLTGSVEGLRIESCRSTMWIYDRVAYYDEVIPEERSAFERFAFEAHAKEVQ